MRICLYKQMEMYYVEQELVVPNVLENGYKDFSEQDVKLLKQIVLFAGTDDMIEEKHTRLIYKNLPNAELHFIERTHFIAAEEPEKYNQIVECFLLR